MGHNHTLQGWLRSAAGAAGGILVIAASSFSQGVSSQPGAMQSGGHRMSGNNMRSGGQHMMSGRVAAQDRRFAMMAAQGGAMEVALGQVAQKNGSSQSVKQFGSRMVRDHTSANKDLEKVAKSVGLTLDWTPGAADQRMMTHLQGLRGAAFDRAYKQHMVQDHKKDVAEFQREASYGRTPALRSFAQRTLPILRSHTQMAIAMRPATQRPLAHRRMSH